MTYHIRHNYLRVLRGASCRRAVSVIGTTRTTTTTTTTIVVVRSSAQPMDNKEDKVNGKTIRDGVC